MKQSIFDFLRNVRVLYLRSESTRQFDYLEDIFRFMRSTESFNLDATQWGLLVDYVNDGDYDREVETKIAESFAHAAKDPCFFEAEFLGTYCTCLCFGDSTIEGGDILMPIKHRILQDRTIHHRMYEMCALRMVRSGHESGAMATMENCRTQKLYYLVGRAWLALPTRRHNVVFGGEWPIVELQVC